MKKFNNSLTELTKDGGVESYDANVISVYDLVNIYLNKYEDEKDCQNAIVINKELLSKEDEKLVPTISMLPNNDVFVRLCKESGEKVLDIAVDCYDLKSLKLISFFDYNDDIYSKDDISNYINKLSEDILSYAKRNIDFIKNFDSSHKTIQSVNSNSFLYLVDNEVLLFYKRKFHIDMSLNEDRELCFDNHFADLDLLSDIEGNEEIVTKNIYVSIEDCPSFMREDLYNKRKEQLENESSIDYNNKSLKKVLRKLKK